ncbi:MAG: hypothetical protein ACI9PY_000406 [Ascidiaceihabitans sp.]
MIDAAAKEAVQCYVDSTYLLNPLYNAFLAGLKPGPHRMIDLAPDNWHLSTDPPKSLWSKMSKSDFARLVGLRICKSLL